MAVRVLLWDGHLKGLCVCAHVSVYGSRTKVVKVSTYPHPPLYQEENPLQRVNEQPRASHSSVQVP